MGMQITVTISDATYQRATNLARLMGNNVDDVLANTLETSLALLSQDDRPSITELNDEELITLAESRMESKASHRHRALLDKQQAGTLTEAEYVELIKLLHYYEEGQLRKTLAQVEAVRRGLIDPKTY